jgi:enolase
MPTVARPGFPQFLVRGHDPKMPMPMTNLISGGAHAGGQLDFQDFLVMPVGAKTYREGLEWIVRVYRRLGELLGAGGYEAVLVGDEGGYGPRLRSARQACEFVTRAIQAAGLQPREQAAIALDVASSRFYKNGKYVLTGDDAGELTSDQMIDYLDKLVSNFPIVSIEDGLAEDDWAGWQALTRRLARRVWLVGDDLFTTNSQRLLKGMERGAANSVLIKVNQIGTLSETLRTLAIARRAGFATVVSARSGETEDTRIADLAVGTTAGQIKIGSVVRGERLVKYNRLLRIAEEIEG